MSETSKPKIGSTVDLTKDWELPVPAEEIPSFEFSIRDPFVATDEGGSATFYREPHNKDEEDLKLRILARCFADCFRGNNGANHYIHGEDGTEKGWYITKPKGIEMSDFWRHLRGEEPSLLSIPILASGKCHFADGDVDCHNAGDKPVDHAALARRIAQMNLPLIVSRSRRPQGAHLTLFFKEEEGCPAPIARQLIEHYLKLLGLAGEVFPKQEDGPDKLGSGINLPYYGNTRVAFGDDGQELSLEDFLCLVAKRRAYGVVLADRDLMATGVKQEPLAAKDDQPKTVEDIRAIYEKHLATFRAMKLPTDCQNDQLNTCAWFAARAHLSLALGNTEEELKNELRAIARSTPHCDGIESTITSGWRSGIADGPFPTIDTKTAHAAALARVDGWLGDPDQKDPPPKPKSEQAYEDLALLTEEEYEERRDLSGQRLNIRKEALDRFVTKRRPKQAKEDDAGMDMDFKDCTPWPEPVNGRELLSKVAKMIRRFMILKHKFDAEIIATWAMGTHCPTVFSIYPRLGFTSPLPDSGKTTGIDVLDHLCLRAARADNLTTPVVFRIIEMHHPCLLLDELDTFIKENSELVGVLNSGHRKGGFVYRMSKVDDMQIMERFGTYGPLAYGMLGYPSGTLFSRTIYIRMERKSAKQIVEDFELDENPVLADELTVLRRQLARWALDHSAHVRDARPDTGTLINRNRNNWKALLKIAQAVGGDWPSIILTAAGVPPPTPKKSSQEKILRDIQNIFHSRGVDRIPSTVLLADLLLQKESGWYRYHQGREDMGFEDLAELLNDFGIEPKPIRIGKDAQAKLFETATDKQVIKRGYELEQFSALFEKYVTGEPQTVEVSRNHNQPF